MITRLFGTLSALLFAVPALALQAPAGQSTFEPVENLPPADQLPAAPLLIAVTGVRIGASPRRLRPIDHIAQLGAPLLLLHGAIDRHTRIEEAKAVFAAAAEPKAMWIVEGAAHVDLHHFAKEAYEARVGGFLAKYLRRP